MHNKSDNNSQHKKPNFTLKQIQTSLNQYANRIPKIAAFENNNGSNKQQRWWNTSSSCTFNGYKLMKCFARQGNWVKITTLTNTIHFHKKLNKVLTMHRSC